MQVLESKQYSNFVNSINSEQTRRQYEYSLTQFLKHYQIDMDSFLGLSQKEYKYNSACTTSIGIDPGFGSSKFAITVLQYEDSIIKVLYAKQWDRPSYEDMINQVVRLKFEYNPTKIYIDSANPDFIKSVKIQFRDNPDYESVIEQANHEKVDYEYRMQVIPVSFSQHGKDLLGRYQYFVSKGLFSIPSTFADLIMDMRTASYLDNGNLDKKASWFKDI